MTRTRDPEELPYRWVILATSFLVRFLLFGSLYSVGVLYVAWLDEFQTSKGNTAWIGSLATGSALLAGPLGSALISRIGTRKTVVLGGIIMASGMLLSVFAQNIYYLFFTYGIIAGTGGGIANLASVVRLADYFKKNRALAMGIGSSGVGLGAFLFTVFQQYLLQEYGWRGSLLIMGGICLNICVAGLLMIHPRCHPDFMTVQIKSIDMNSNEKSDEKSTSFDQTMQEMKSVITESNLNSPQSLDVGDDLLKDEEARQIFSPEAGVLIKKDSSITVASPKKSMSSQKRRKSSFFQKVMFKMKFKDQTIALWRDPVFLLLFVSDFMSWVVQFVPYVHLPERARLLGISPLHSAILVSSMGFAGAVGKVVFGAVCTCLKLNPLKTFTIAQILFGASTILSPLCQSFESLLAYALCFGFLSGAYALMMVIPADLLGYEKFSAAYGFLLAGEGIGVYLGPPIAGWITDASATYETSFYCSGVVLLASGLILLLIPCAERLRKR